MIKPGSYHEYMLASRITSSSGKISNISVHWSFQKRLRAMSITSTTQRHSMHTVQRLFRMVTVNLPFPKASLTVVFNQDMSIVLVQRHNQHQSRISNNCLQIYLDDSALETLNLNNSTIFHVYLFLFLFLWGCHSQHMYHVSLCHAFL